MRLLVSMSYFITESHQTKLLTTLSIYSQRGETSDQGGLLYMNDVAFSVWKAYGKEPKGYRLTTSTTVDGPARVWHPVQ